MFPVKPSVPLRPEQGGFPLERVPLLDAYVALVRRHSRSLGLVSASDLDRFERRHIHDCLRVLPLLEHLPAGPGIDVGSGAGLPGIPLAIAAPNRHWRLLEPRAKRAAFLEEVVRSLGLDCDVLRLRAEAAAERPDLVRTHALATARAVAPPQRAFELLRPLVTPGGVSIVFAGPRAQAPLQAEEWDEGLLIIRAEPEQRSGGSQI
jgi:16S rRNA (guanine527-N7)-methyltransferase